jgi:hypothetical protein
MRRYGQPTTPDENAGSISSHCYRCRACHWSDDVAWRVVRIVELAFLQPAQLDFRTGLDNTLYPHRNRGMADLAARWVVRVSVPGLDGSDVAELALDAAFLRRTCDVAGLGRDHLSSIGHPWLHCRVPRCGSADLLYSICALGRLRLASERIAALAEQVARRRSEPAPYGLGCAHTQKLNSLCHSRIGSINTTSSAVDQSRKGRVS